MDGYGSKNKSSSDNLDVLEPILTSVNVTAVSNLLDISLSVMDTGAEVGAELIFL